MMEMDLLIIEILLVQALVFFQMLSKMKQEEQELEHHGFLVFTTQVMQDAV